MSLGCSAKPLVKARQGQISKMNTRGITNWTKHNKRPACKWPDRPAVEE